MMCPDVSLDHVVKEAIFTDCSEDRNLQPDNPFRTTYPDEKGFILQVMIHLMAPGFHKVF